jgi:hypothetical protein
MPTYQIGRLGRVFFAKQSTYGTAPTFAATDALRHTNCVLNKSLNRVPSQERFAHPSLLSKWLRRTTGDFSLSGLLYPSGTIGTVPDVDELFEVAFGTKTNITPLSTTIASASTTTGAVVAAATGLTVGQAVLINVTTGSPATGRVLRWLTAVAGTTLTWAPALPQAAAVGDTLKSCVNYSLATALPNAVSIGHYMTSTSKEGTGAVVDMLKILFDANDEVRWEASGPMKDRLATAQSQPGSFTTVGSTPPSGLIGGMRWGSGAVDFLKLAITINNTMELDNFNFGTSSAAGFFRKNQRTVNIELTAMLTDDQTLLTAAETGTDSNVLLAQCGQTEGNIVGVYCPNVDLDVPAHPDGEETLELQFSGSAKGVSGNDELRLAIA